MKFHTQFDPPPAGEKEYPGTGRTQQHMKDECDINLILKRFEKTGQLQHVNGEPPRYGDFTNVTDYQTAVQRVAEADREFLELPAHIRSRFHNSPGELLDFLSNDSNLAEAVELGFIEVPEVESPIAVHIIPMGDAPPPEGE